MLSWPWRASQCCSAPAVLAWLLLSAACTQLESSQQLSDVDAGDDKVIAEGSDAQSASDASPEEEQSDARAAQADATDAGHGSAASAAAQGSATGDAGTDTRTDGEAAQDASASAGADAARDAGTKSDAATPNDYPKAVRWVASTRTLERIDPSGHEESYSCGISGNGSVVVGYTYNPDTAFVWRAGNTGLTALPTLNGSQRGSGRAVSQNGNVTWSARTSSTATYSASSSRRRKATCSASWPAASSCSSKASPR